MIIHSFIENTFTGGLIMYGFIEITQFDSPPAESQVL